MSGVTGVPWVAITLTDLQNAQAGALVTAFQTSALASGQADPTGKVINDVTQEILGAVGFSGRYTMDASQGTVVPDVLPPNLLNMAVAKVCRKMRGRLEMPLMPDQIEDERTFQRTLQLLRDGRYPVTATSNPSGTDISGNPGLVALNPGQWRRFTPGQLNNL